MDRFSFFLIALGVGACSSSDTSPVGVGADAGFDSSVPPADGGTSEGGRPDAAVPPGPAALGTCAIAVDGASYAYPPASGFGGATAVKRGDELNIDCRVQSGPSVVQVVQLLTRGATQAGSHSFVATGAPTGLSRYSTTDVGGMVQTKYQASEGWKLELTTSTDAAVQGTATFTGKSDDGSAKSVVLSFHLKAEM